MSLFLYLFLGYLIGRALILIVTDGRAMLAAKKQPKAISQRSATAGMSKASKELFKQYKALPAEHRPFDDISGILRALDAKYDVGEINRHFERYNGYDTEFSWDCLHRGWNRNLRCELNDFVELKKQMDEVTDAVKKKEHALKMQGYSHDLDMLTQLTEALRVEHTVVKSVTKEITS